METTEYSHLADLENSYWWHVGRKSLIEQLLSLHFAGRDGAVARILNVGCGTGGTIPILQKYGEVFNTDTSDVAVEIARQRGVRNITLTDTRVLPFEDESFDLVVALDVLEHIEDDGGALLEWRRMLKPGGRVLITVPAYQWLWSEHDEALHHFRRYNAAGLHKLLNLSGFKIIRRTYAITTSFPIIVLYRLLKSLFPNKRPSTSYVILPPAVNQFFIWMLRAESFYLRHGNLPFGTSVMMIAEKR